jgi:uncharacterized protein YggE
MAMIERLKRLPLLAGLTLGLLATVPVASAQAQPAVPGQETQARLISTQGYGEVRVRPDSFRTTVGVEARAETLEQARNEVNTKMQRVTEALNRLGIEGLTLQTETLRILPIYSRPREGELATIIGYHAANAVSATVRRGDYERLGDVAARVVDAAVRAGANEVRGISFFIDDASVARRRALQEAVNDAEANARAMAQAAEVILLGLHSMQGSPERMGGPMLIAFERGAADGAPTPIETGEVVISSSVTASFDFRSR